MLLKISVPEEQCQQSACQGSWTDVEKGYVYPSSGRANGQLFFCITFPLATVETISYHLQLQEAKVYQSRYLPWTSVFPQFSSLLKKKYMKKAKNVRVDVLHTRKGISVLAIAKSPRWLNDVYTKELSRLINDSMTVQTWRKGAGGVQNQHCSALYSVTDVEDVGVQTQRGVLAFSSREDHSKWSVARSKAVFCFSSLNRMMSQWKRGGEITCISDMALANLFRKSISKRNKCRAER
ncbi:hypothetical protein HPB50_015852 [Hyalomma asiaticum]|uniref:Uncharacterized protein n=1 Tax=Hyalomma asiaticum TaxID=266040 RepID=A0ACB7S0B3_HYAAI|nr:hypothetical protein HPB50_015852 [Hyalomma asiaticum]